jgi:hypothetical protein
MEQGNNLTTLLAIELLHGGVYRHSTPQHFTMYTQLYFLNHDDTEQN